MVLYYLRVYDKEILTSKNIFKDNIIDQSIDYCPNFSVGLELKAGKKARR